MRFPLACLLCLAACSSSPDRDDPASRRPPESARTRIVYRQYRAGTTDFVLENLAGRDLKELRSRPLRRGEVPVAYVEDEVMKRLLDEFEKLDFFEHARPRPADPARLGAVGEITLVDERGRMTSLLRIRIAPGVQPDRAYIERSEAWVACTRNFLAVWNYYRPQLQATASAGSAPFGVKRADEQER